MKHKLSISKNEVDEIIKREIAVGFKKQNLYTNVAKLSPITCKLPPRNGKCLDFDYQLMQIECNYEIADSDMIPINDITVSLRAKILDYGKIHDDPYIRPGGCDAWNLPCYLEIIFPKPINIKLDLDESGHWSGNIDWNGITLEESMYRFRTY